MSKTAENAIKNLRKIARRNGLSNGDIAKQMGRNGKNAGAKVSSYLTKGGVNFRTFCALCDAIAALSSPEEGIDFNEIFGVKPTKRAKK